MDIVEEYAKQNQKEVVKYTYLKENLESDMIQLQNTLDIIISCHQKNVRPSASTFKVLKSQSTRVRVGAAQLETWSK